jgi:hypothetical protein
MFAVRATSDTRGTLCKLHARDIMREIALEPIKDRIFRNLASANRMAPGVV